MHIVRFAAIMQGATACHGVDDVQPTVGFPAREDVVVQPMNRRRARRVMNGDGMPRTVRNFPTRDRLKQMTLVELDDHIGGLRAELRWRRTGPVHEELIKRMEAALKVRDLRDGDRSSGSTK